MAKVDGLNRRGSNFYLRIVIPRDLQQAYGKSRVNVTLGTSDRRKALFEAMLKRAEWLADFERRRHVGDHEVSAAQTSPSLAVARTIPSSVEATHALSGSLRGLGGQVKAATRVGHKSQRQEVVRSPVPPSQQRTLRDVYERWKASGEAPRSSDSVAAYDRALRQFEGQHPALLLVEITREMGDSYRSWLRETCRTTKTARDRFTTIKSLLKFATETLEWTPKQPWLGLDIKSKTTNKRRPWTLDELRCLFGASLHASHALPGARYAGKDAAYWIPLLGLYTGARLGELCQLRTQDVQIKDGIHVLVLTDEGDGQKIKSEAGHRSVPIHSELLRLGFLGYVDATRQTNCESLWPSLPLRQGKPADLFGRWFKEHCGSLGLQPTFHYFRHTVRPLMRKAGHDEGTMDKITGHKSVGSIGAAVYDHRTLCELSAAVEAIRYPGVMNN